MPQEEQSEWPSFEAVLRDVAPSDVAQRTQTAIATSRRALSGDDITVSKAAPVAAPTAVPDSPFAEAPPVARPLADLNLDLLPAPLAPLELDTSAVRALLEPRPRHIDEELSLDALAPLEPPAEVEVPDVAEPDDVAELDVAELGVAEAEGHTSDPVEFVVDVPYSDVPDHEGTDPEVPDGQTFESSPFEASAFESAPFEASPFEASPFEASPFESSLFTSDVDDSLADVPGIEIPDATAASVQVFDDLQLGDDLVLDHELGDALPFEDDEREAGTVFELDESQLSAAEALDAAEADTEETHASVDFFTDPSLDLFDLNIGSDEIESDRIDLHGPDLYADTPAWSEHIEDTTPDPDTFDSIAMADEIEGALSELSDLDDLEEETVEHFDLDNVIPIRPDHNPIDEPDSLDAFASLGDTEPTSDAKMPKHTSWVGLDEVAAPAPEAESEIDDPWAHMRPDEEPKAKGLWSRIPKFFGGEERHNARKAREASSPVTNGEPQVDITFDSKCPNCGDECQVDLDDPIGRRVHVSCPSCDHMWFTAYTIDGEAESDARTG